MVASSIVTAALMAFAATALFAPALAVSSLTQAECEGAGFRWLTYTVVRDDGTFPDAGCYANNAILSQPTMSVDDAEVACNTAGANAGFHGTLAVLTSDAENLEVQQQIGGTGWFGLRQSRKADGSFQDKDDEGWSNVGGCPGLWGVW